MRTQPNDPARAGQLASRKTLFGERRRYAVAAVHTRFEAVTYFVWDAERPDEDGRPTIVRQESSLKDAVAGLRAFEAEVA